MEKFTVKQFARKCGVHIRTLQRWRQSGKLIPDYDFAGRPFYADKHLIMLKMYKSGVYSLSLKERLILTEVLKKLWKEETT